MDSGDRLFEIAVNHLGRIPFRLRPAAKHFGERHRAMASTRASESHREITFSLGNVIRKQIADQALKAAHELTGLRERANVTRHARILAAEGAKARNKMRIGEKAHVENQIGI